MDKAGRHKQIIKLLKESEGPISGHQIAERLNVSRQIIVRDVADLRTDGLTIRSTSRGYILDEKTGIRKIIAVHHSADDIREELSTIIHNAGKIIDVMVEHPVYGELKGEIAVSNEKELAKFLALIQGSRARALLSVSEGGVHLHTIEVENEEQYQKILEELRTKGFLLE